MKKAFYILVFCSINILSYAQSDTVSSRMHIKGNDSPQGEIKQSGSETYKILYENIKSNNEELIHSFQWAIGSILLIIIAIFGGSIYFNFRFNKNELLNLLQKVDLRINEIKAELLKNQSNEIQRLENSLIQESQKLNDKFRDLKDDTISDLLNDIKDFTTKVEMTLANYQNKYSSDFEKLTENLNNRVEIISNQYQNQLNTFNENYKQQISSLNQNTNNQIESLNKSVDKQISSLQQILNSHLNEITNEFETINNSLLEKDINQKRLTKDIEQKLTDLELSYKRAVALINAKIWEQEKVYSNALRYHIEANIIMKQMGWGNLSIYLGDVINNLKKIDKISEYDKKRIEEFIELISSEDQAIVAQIRELYNEKK